MTLEDGNYKQSRSDRPHQPHLQEGIRANQDSAFSRREFVGMAAASLLMAGTLNGSAAEERKNGIPYRTLGRTGERVSVIGLGGYHLGKQSDPEESIRIIRSGMDEGINFLDNCWDYNGGESEIRMGKALRGGYRQKAFLMTKIDGRTKTELPLNLTNHCGGCRPIELICCSSMK
jgi:aldo/keto reductase family protein